MDGQHEVQGSIIVCANHNLVIYRVIVSKHARTKSARHGATNLCYRLMTSSISNSRSTHLYRAIIWSMTTRETSIFVSVVKPSSNMSSLSREFPQPTIRMLSSLRTYCETQSFNPE